ncbi:MAG: hypothetical protein ABSC37_08090 [Xanthobacteraceae bacterium]
MSLPKKIAAIAAPIASVALLLAVPALAQNAPAAAPKAQANLAAAPAAGALQGMALPHPSAAATVRPSTQAFAAGTASAVAQAPKAANELK